MSDTQDKDKAVGAGTTSVAKKTTSKKQVAKKKVTKKKATPKAAAMDKPGTSKKTVAKKTTAKKTSAKKAPAKKTSSKKTPVRKTTAKKTTATAAVQRISYAHYRERIATAAYFLAQKRLFENGLPEQDWLEAEAQISAELRAAGIEVEPE